MLSYHRCNILQKSACGVYYSSLRQAIHGRVTSEVSIPKITWPFFFSRFKSLTDELRFLAAYMSLITSVVSLYLHYLLKRNNFISVICLFHKFTISFYLYRENESSPESALTCLDMLTHTHIWNYTFAPRVSCILMCRYCFHVHQWLVCDSLTVYSLSADDVMVTTFLKSIKILARMFPIVCLLNYLLTVCRQW